jgi:hypothetical protein
VPYAVGLSRHPSLAKEQEVAWAKFKRDHVGGYYVISYDRTLRRWLFWTPLKPLTAIPILSPEVKLSGNLSMPVMSERFTFYEQLSAARAQVIAESCSKDSTYSISAVINFDAEPVPQIVCWFYDDGNGPKRHEQCPLSSKESDLIQFLMHCKASVD